MLDFTASVNGTAVGTRTASYLGSYMEIGGSGLVSHLAGNTIRVRLEAVVSDKIKDIGTVEFGLGDAMPPYFGWTTWVSWPICEARPPLKYAWIWATP